MICKNIELKKELNILVKALNKIDNEPVYCIFGVCNEFIRKMKDDFFMILDKRTVSLGNDTLFTALKEKTTLIKHFEPI